MENKPEQEKPETKLLKIMLPEELLERVLTYCDERDMTVKEFMTDTISDKSITTPKKVYIKIYSPQQKKRKKEGRG